MYRQVLSSLLLVVFFGCGLASCVSSDVARDVAPKLVAHPHKSATSHEPLPPPALNGDLWERMRHNLALPDYANRPEVQQRIHWFQHNQKYLSHVIGRSAPYIYYIYQQTQIRHLPAELALIPIVESDYNPTAYNVSGASGLWQMMPDTASGFGLKRDWWYDGRHDVVASTNAALNFFNYLHSFCDNDWLLALAAYDWGPGAVQRAMRSSQAHYRGTDFWSMCPTMPAETRDYVPRLLALAAIVRNPERYNIQLLPINDAPYVEQVNVGTQIDIGQAAKLAGVSIATLHHLNPGYRRWATDPNGPYTLLLPVSNVEQFKTNLAVLPPNERTGFRYHIVKAGETLEKIATRYKTSIAILSRINKLRAHYHLQEHQGIVLPGSNVELATAVANSTSSSPTKTEDSAAATSTTPIVAAADTTLPSDDPPAESTPTHVVYLTKRGDTLEKVANKYHVTPTQLAKWNHLNRHHHHLHSGRHLVIHPAAKQEQQVATATTASTSRTAETNKLTANLQHEYAADKTHSTSAPHTIRYTVRSGDVLNKIAKRFDVSVNDLKRWNRLSHNTLHPGKKLIIYKTA